MPETYLTQLSHFTSFLLAYIHSLLYLRSLYPPTSFARSRFHNTPVYQSRHPAVCEWIRDAVSAVRDELLSGKVARISIVIYWHGGHEAGGNLKLMERHMLDVSAFPVVPKGDRNIDIEWGISASSLQEPENEGKGKGKARQKPKPIDVDVPVDLSEQFRAAFIALNTRCSQLKALPKNCSFNVAMELKDEPDIDPPIGHPQPWVPVQGSLQKTGRKGRGENEEGKRNEGGDLGGVRVTPIRAVEAGVFRFETWIEEGKAKFEVDESANSSFASFGG